MQQTSECVGKLNVTDPNLDLMLWASNSLNSVVWLRICPTNNDTDADGPKVRSRSGQVKFSSQLTQAS